MKSSPQVNIPSRKRGGRGHERCSSEEEGGAKRRKVTKRETTEIDVSDKTAEAASDEVTQMKGNTNVFLHTGSISDFCFSSHAGDGEGDVEVARGSEKSIRDERTAVWVL